MSVSLFHPSVANAVRYFRQHHQLDGHSLKLTTLFESEFKCKVFSTDSWNLDGYIEFDDVKLETAFILKWS